MTNNLNPADWVVVPKVATDEFLINLIELGKSDYTPVDARGQ